MEVFQQNSKLFENGGTEKGFPKILYSIEEFLNDKKDLV